MYLVCRNQPNESNPTGLKYCLRLVPFQISHLLKPSHFPELISKSDWAGGINSSKVPVQLSKGNMYLFILFYTNIFNVIILFTE